VSDLFIFIYYLYLAQWGWPT